MTRVTRRLTAKNRDQLRNHTLGNRVWATFNFITTRLHSNGRGLLLQSDWRGMRSCWLCIKTREVTVQKRLNRSTDRDDSVGSWNDVLHGRHLTNTIMLLVSSHLAPALPIRSVVSALYKFR